MCGIAGAVRLDGAPAEAGVVRLMNGTMLHRGPDEEGFAAQGCAAVAMRRLSIIDVAHGHQPAVSEDGGVAVVLNGEIYNFRELRARLEGCGHRFATRSDTEAIVHAYEEWGDDCVRYLRGMFAFAVVDRRASAERPRVLVARDPLGIKPLYWWSDGILLLFASEVRALLASERVPRKLDLDGVRSYLAYGSVQEPYTLVQGVRSLPPGHLLRWAGGAPEERRFWSLPAAAEAGRRPVDRRAMEEVGCALEAAVSSQLVADVPLGLFLSGGIDSSAIAALVRRADVGPARTFSIVFEEARYDEREFARLAAETLGTEHTELCLSSESVRAQLGRALSSFDQPSVDGLNTYVVSRAVRDAGLTVALSGVGGDELFGGYGAFGRTRSVERWGQRLRRIPRPARAAAAAVAGVVPREAARRAADLLESDLDPYFFSRRLFTERQVARLLSPGALEASRGWAPQRFTELARETAGYDPVNRASALELQTYMLSTLLRDTDQMSMAHSLEVRVPLLDQDLVELMFTLDGAGKLEPGQPKPLLTRPLEDVLPRACVHRPKRGFELPLARWLRESLGAQVRGMLTDPAAVAGLPFAPRGLAEVWTRFERGALGWSRAWALFVLLHWLREHRVAP
jgi:asparagine synthase (glutamine-hydrolysing)